MKSLHILAIAALGLLPLSPGHAALDPKIVNADARWLVHVDFNLLRESEIGRKLLELANKNHPANAETPVTVDFQKVLAAVGKATAYGSNFDHKPELVDGSLVVEGTADLRKIAEGYVAQAMLSTPEAITEIKDLPFEAYSLHGDVFIGFPKEQIIIVSKMKSQLVRAQELYRGKGASLAKASSSPLRDLIPASRDAFLVAASVVPGESIAAEGGPQARLIRMANSASIALGEKDKLTFANIKLIADSADAADKLQKIVQGLTAMASLTHSNNNDLEEFMKSVTVERQDLAVQLNLAYSSERLSGMIQNLQQAHRHQEHETHSEESGKVIAQWKADQDLGSDQPDEKIFTSHAIDNVQLASGAIIRLTGNADAGEHARIDYLEVHAADNSSPALKFEAEYMKLSHYHSEKVPAASGGKVIMARGRAGVAELQFPGAAGTYNVTVRYLDESDGKSTFTLRVDEPAADEKE
jgi:hypothetical protein